MKNPVLVLIMIFLSGILYSQDSGIFSTPAVTPPLGYTWIDSDEQGGPAFNWMDISSTGTAITGLVDDNVVGPFDMGFNFSFYGDLHSQFWVNSNGCISFNDKLLPFANWPIPTAHTYTDFIAWFWDDLTAADSNTSVFYESFGDSILVIQFNDYAQYLQQANYITAQVLMYKNGNIIINYNEADPGFILDSETIGIQSPDSTIGLQVANNEPYVHDRLALLIMYDENVAVGINESESGEQEDPIVVYPNPANDHIHIDLTNVSALTGSFSIHDLAGRLMIHDDIHLSGGKQHLTIEINMLENGIYCLTVDLRGKVSSQKILIAD